MLALISTIQAKPQHREAFVEELKKHARLSVETEPGCLRYDVVQDLADPNRFHLYQVCVDEATLIAYHNTPHNLEWRETVKDWRAPGLIKRECVTVYPPPRLCVG